MTTITVSVPDAQVQFFLDLVQELHFDAKEGEQIEITEDEKQLMKMRLKNAQQSDFKNWSQIKGSFLK